MLLRKTIFCSFLFSLSLSAFAHDLNFSNESEYTFSFRVNGICSQWMGNLTPFTIKHISEPDLNVLCQSNPYQCLMEMYNFNNCIGIPMLAVEFNLINHGISLSQYHPDISSSVSRTETSFNVWITQALHPKKK